MSAGDVLFIGWTGSSPTYKELEPTVSYEPSEDRNSLQKRLTRRLICFSSDKTTLISSLPMDNASVSSVYVDSSGAVQTISYGGGWRMLNMNEAVYKPGYTIISVVYERTISRILETGLPTNVTIAYPSEGTAQIKYKTTVLEQFASNTGSSGSGLQIRSEPITIPTGLMAGTNYASRLSEYVNGNTLYRLWFELDGVKFDEREVTGAELHDYGLVKSSPLKETTNIAGPLAQTPTAAQIEQLRVEAGASRAFVNTVYVNQTITEPFTQVVINSTIGGIYGDSYASNTNPTYKVSIMRVPQYYVIGEFSYSAPHQAYYLKSPGVYTYAGMGYSRRLDLGARWSVVGNILYLKIDNIVWKQWDVSGL